MKKQTFITFQVDHIRYSSLPVLKTFLGTDEGLELKVSEAFKLFPSQG